MQNIWHSTLTAHALRIECHASSMFTIEDGCWNSGGPTTLTAAYVLGMSSAHGRKGAGWLRRRLLWACAGRRDPRRRSTIVCSFAQVGDATLLLHASNIDDPTCDPLSGETLDTLTLDPFRLLLCFSLCGSSLYILPAARSETEGHSGVQGLGRGSGVVTTVWNCR